MILICDSWSTERSLESNTNNKHKSLWFLEGLSTDHFGTIKWAKHRGLKSAFDTVGLPINDQQRPACAYAANDLRAIPRKLSGRHARAFGGNPLESGEDTARALAGDVAKKFQAPSPLAVDEQPLVVQWSARLC